MTKSSPHFVFPLISVFALGIAFGAIVTDISAASSASSSVEERPIVKVELDCNRPEGHKVWKVDSITFYKSMSLTLRNGDIKEDVDASSSLCSIVPYVSPRTSPN